MTERGMPTTSAVRPDSYGGAVAGATVEAPSSSVAWVAITGGAFAAASSTVILVALGSGVGLASISPWPNLGATATTFTVMTAIWLIVVQWLSAGLGGYLTGRLRTKWVGVHTHEVYFRDTANGFLAWAVASVLGATILASVTSSLVGGATQGASRIVAGAAQGASQGAATTGVGSLTDPSAYLVDSLFRSDNAPSANAPQQDVRVEAGRILATGLRNGDVPAADKAYLARLVAARTGLSQADAEKRVNDVIAQAKEAEVKTRQAADAARKAGAHLAFFTAFAMLIGAFIAAAAGALGGHHRDESDQLSVR